jgi:MFS transporter, FSR family, fosmidomycin resistance protein
MIPSFLRDQRYLANAFGHFTIDILNSTVPLLLAVFSVSLGLSNAAIGFIVTIYTFGNSLMQPLFGWAADKYGSRWLGIGGILWMALFYSLAAISPGWWAILFLTVTGLGSAAYHPQGAVRAGQVDLRLVATGTAYFFLFGQLGLGIGPAVAGGMIEVWGRSSLLILAGINVLAAIWLWRSPPREETEHQHVPAETQRTALRFGLGALVLFAVLLFTRGTVQSTTNTFLPKYLQDIGWSPAVYGVALSMLMIGSAFGTVIGGSMADRFGRRKIVAGSMFLATIPLWIYLDTTGLVFFALVFLIGLLTGSGFAVTVVMAQAMMPGKKALASGLVLGFIFASGAIGAAIAGWVSDQIGLALVLQDMALLALVSGVCALLLPPTAAPVETVAAAPAAGSTVP